MPAAIRNQSVSIGAFHKSKPFFSRSPDLRDLNCIYRTTDLRNSIVYN
jgi:hypothetical protein